MSDSSPAHNERPEDGGHEPPEKGLISDEELPEDLQPTDDNPLAKDPGDEDDSAGRKPEDVRVEGMPDLGSPGAP
jgi:hypothetical protein